MKSVIKHALIVIVGIVMLVVVPTASHFDFFGNTDSDAVTGASIEVPDKPSGDFIIIMNNALHSDSIEDWKIFFAGEELPVIFDDIKCLVASGDATGFDMADRYRIQLPENQMTVRTEDSTLLASKVENGSIDVAIFSAEFADALQLDPGKAGDSVTVIRVSGASDGDDSEGGGASSDDDGAASDEGAAEKSEEAAQ